MWSDFSVIKLVSGCGNAIVGSEQTIDTVCAINMPGHHSQTSTLLSTAIILCSVKLPVVSFAAQTESVWSLQSGCRGDLGVTQHREKAGTLAVRLHPHVTCCCVLQILEAIACMHEHGIMHRDVKPENIMFAQSVETSRDNPKSDQVFNVKVIDLGMAACYSPKVPLRGLPSVP